MSAIETLPQLALIGGIGLPELTIFGFIVLLLFGNRLPSVMRSLGVGITEFKKGINGEGMEDQTPKITEARPEAPKS